MYNITKYLHLHHHIYKNKQHKETNFKKPERRLKTLKIKGLMKEISPS
jgi:hypothetical protein